jgi:hypothetical protein
MSVPPLLAPAKLVQYLKGKSSRLLQEDFPHLRKRYWGQHMWARGYFCATVGVVDEKTIMEYIENQKWDDDAGSFKITGPTKPQAGLSRELFKRLPAATATFSRNTTYRLQPVVVEGRFHKFIGALTYKPCKPLKTRGRERGSKLAHCVTQPA